MNLFRRKPPEGFVRTSELHEAWRRAGEAERQYETLRLDLLNILDRSVTLNGVSGPVTMLVSELVRDQGELEARIEAALIYLHGLMNRPTSATDQELSHAVALLRGKKRVPDTLGEMFGEEQT